MTLEESNKGWGKSTGDDGSSGDEEDSDESDTTGMIFFLVFLFLVSFSSVNLPSFILVLVPMACNTVVDMTHTNTFTPYLVIAWQT
jgi:hypothetical protein